MPLAWNEINDRALKLALKWSEASSERSDSQTFWNEFFHVFGRDRSRLAVFEQPVKNLEGHTDFVDVFWEGRMIGETKSRGKDLGKAYEQALGYAHSLAREHGEKRSAQRIVLTDFEWVELFDLDPPADAASGGGGGEVDTATGVLKHRFRLRDLPANAPLFAFLSGHQTRALDPEDPANLEAALLLANLHDRLEDGGYGGHDLQVFMVRVLFCLFAENTDAIPRDGLKTFLRNNTREDGSDLGQQLALLFQVLDTPPEARQKQLLAELREMPYINGSLFKEQLRFASFDAGMRTALLECCAFRWEEISPAIFGSLFQSIMEPRERRQIGAHYTSERDILKLIRSLFLDGLRADFERAKKDGGAAVRRFHERLAGLKFLDPACGCGNFLLIAYRELRQLELEALLFLHGGGVQRRLDFDVRASLKVNVDQMHGIEIEEWPARIAEVALWLLDHQMNQRVEAAFGQLVARFPLKASAAIRCGNALRLDWNEVLPAGECDYVMGNPPFVGHHLQTPEQKADQNRIWHDASARGVLDFVTCWYRLAAEYARPSLREGKTRTRIGFVSTNSIAQGEQPGIFWPPLFGLGCEIFEAHRTFQWTSEARGAAHVHVVIVCFERGTPKRRRIWSYPDGGAGVGVVQTSPAGISPYLLPGPSLAVGNRTHPLGPVPPMRYGSKPTDGGNLLLTPAEREALLEAEPAAEPWVRRYVGAREVLHGEDRYCLWLEGIEPGELKALPRVRERVAAVKAFREASKAKSTREHAAYPTRFRQVAQPDSAYIVFPGHSSERRAYIPLAYLGPEVIASNACFFVPDAMPFHFGVLTSAMHMAWVEVFCGRLESRYRYSKTGVYNTFPWPDATDVQRLGVSEAAAGVLSARAAHPDATLATLYDPDLTPPDLAKAHKALDRAVDRCYRPAPFADGAGRFEHLFKLYEAAVTPMAKAVPGKKRGRS